MSDIKKFTAIKDGLVPASGGGFGKFLRADGEWIDLTFTGSLGDGNKGDITIVAGNWEINADSVTFTELQNIDQDRILGRINSGNGSVEELERDDVRQIIGLTPYINAITSLKI